MRLHSVFFIEGPACGNVLKVARVQEEYVFRGTSVYTVDGSGGKWRAWYAGEQDVTDTELGRWVDETEWEAR